MSAGAPEFEDLSAEEQAAVKERVLECVEAVEKAAVKNALSKYDDETVAKALHQLDTLLDDHEELKQTSTDQLADDYYAEFAEVLRS